VKGNAMVKENENVIYIWGGKVKENVRKREEKVKVLVKKKRRSRKRCISERSKTGYRKRCG
jgi:hypothetical protein